MKSAVKCSILAAQLSIFTEGHIMSEKKCDKKSIGAALLVCGAVAVAAAATVAAYKYRREIREYVDSWGSIKLKRVPDTDDAMFTADVDGDGTDDTVFVDSDGDGSADTAFVDTDGDGKVDVVLSDTDGDGKFDTLTSGEAAE